MGDFAQMHVFFVLASVAVVLFAIFVSLALYYVVRILRTVDRFTQQALDEAALVRGDIADLRASVKREGAKIKQFARFGKKFVERMSPVDDDTHQ